MRRPADKAREGGIPGVFRPKRNDERRAATRFSRDGSPAERRVGFITGCLAGMDRRPNAAWVSLPVVWPGWIAGRAPTGRTGPRGFHYRLFGRDGSPAEPPPGELGRVGFTTGCLAGMDRRPSPHRENWAAWVSLPAVWPGWIAGRAPTGRTGPRGFHYRLFGRDGSPAEPPPGELGRVGFITGCLAGMDRRPSPHRENWAAWVSLPAVELPTGDYRGLPGITGITGSGPQLPGNRHGCAYRSSVPDERLSPAPALPGRKPTARAISRARARPYRRR